MSTSKETQLAIGIKKEMSFHLDKLRKEQETLLDKLNKGFDNETFKSLNIINHRIEVAESRSNGEWLKGDFPVIADVACQNS
jgi:hypothetical protein